MSEALARIVQQIREDFPYLGGRDRLQTVRDLAPYAGAGAVKALLEELAAADSDPRVQMVARETSRQPRAADAADRLEGLEALTPPLDEASSAALEERLRSSADPLELACALLALARCAGAHASTTLETSARDCRPRVAAAALQGLGEALGSQAVQSLVAALAGDSPQSESGYLAGQGRPYRAGTLARLAAARTLHRLSPDAALAALVPLLRDSPGPADRESAQSCLAALGTQECLDLLAASLVTETDSALAERAAELLARSPGRRAVYALSKLGALEPGRARLTEQIMDRLRQTMGRAAVESLVARAAARPASGESAPGARAVSPEEEPDTTLRASRAVRLFRAAWSRPGTRRGTLALAVMAALAAIGLATAPPPPALTTPAPAAALEAGPSGRFSNGRLPGWNWTGRPGAGRAASALASPALRRAPFARTGLRPVSEAIKGEPR